MANNTFFVGPLERVVYLRTVPGLRSLGFQQLVSIAQRARERFFPKGSFLLERGQEGAFHLVVEGQVQVWRAGQPSQIIGPQEVVGFLHLLARADERLEARAEVDTLTLEFDSDAQMDLCEEHFEILLNFASFLSGSLMRERIKHLGLRGPTEADACASASARKGPALVERVLTLFESPAFCNCSVDGLGELARHLEDARFQSNELIWNDRELADYFLLVASGKVECRADAGRFQVGPGGLVGMEEVLSHELRWHGARACGAVDALRIDAEPFLDILEDHFEMAIQFLSSTALRVIELQELNAGLAPAVAGVD